jgi:hypothetical protein
MGVQGRRWKWTTTTLSAIAGLCVVGAGVPLLEFVASHT